MKVVRVTALWCMSCLSMKRVWNKTFKAYPEIEIIDYDYDFDQEKVKAYQVGKILPELVFIKDDVVVARAIGEKSKKEMIKLLEVLNEKN